MTSEVICPTCDHSKNCTFINEKVGEDIKVTMCLEYTNETKRKLDKEAKRLIYD